MDTKKLRQKILDLAIHGKLVPQDPNDEPASVLLERIRAEKEQLIKEGKIKAPKKSKTAGDTSHYEKEGPFELPTGWEWSELSFLCSKIGSGATPRGSNYASTGIPFFRSQNVYNDAIDLTDIKYISHDTHQSMVSTEVLPDDLLLNITGGSLGRCAVVPKDFGKGNVSQHVCILRPVRVLPRYLLCVILSSYFSKHMETTGSGREGLPKYSIEKMLIPVPPIQEQRRIVGEIDVWLGNVSRMETNLLEIQSCVSKTKERILDLAIHGKLVPQDSVDEPAIDYLKRINPGFVPAHNLHYECALPTGWHLSRLGDIADIIAGTTYQKTDIVFDKNGIRVLRGGNIQNGDILLCDDDVYIKANLANKINTIQNGDIAIVASTGSSELIGKAALATQDYPKTQIGAFLRLVRPKSKLISDYLGIIFHSNYYKNYIKNLAKGTNINNIKLSYLADFVIPIPPPEEIRRLMKKIRELLFYLNKITDFINSTE